MSFLKNKELSIYLLLSLLLSLYVVLRAIYVPMVHDESVTFFHYINTGHFVPFIDWGHHADANNHVLNSALSHVFFKWFGNDPWVLRLASVLSFALLLTYVWRIAQFFHHKLPKWSFIIAILGSHYFIEFFSLTRGYGMSMAFLMGAIYHLMRYIIKPDVTQLLRYGIMMLLGLSANLTLVNTALIGFCLIVYMMIRERKQISLGWHATITLLLVLLPVLGAILTGMKYNEMGLLYYGQGDSYIDITVRTFFLRFTLIEQLNYLVYPIIMPVLLMGLGLFVFTIIKKKWLSIYDHGALFAAMFFGNLAASIIQTSFMDVNYPEDRTALFFFPMMVGMITFFADRIKFSRWLLLPFLYLPIQFLMMININYNSFWKNERMTDDFYQTVLADYKEKGEQPVVGGYLMRQVVWDYYNYRNGGYLGRIHGTNHLNDTISDFIIGEEKLNPLWKTLYTKLDTDPYSNLSLFERKVRLQPQLVQASEYEVWIENDSREFINFGEYKADSLGGKYIQSRWVLSYRPENGIEDVWLVLQGIDKDGNQSFYEYFSLERFRENFEDDIAVTQKLVSPPIAEGTVSIRAYIWNLNQQPITVYGGKVSFWEY